MKFNSLMLYHTIPIINNPERRKLSKTLMEKEKMLVTMFSMHASHQNEISHTTEGIPNPYTVKQGASTCTL